MNDQTDAADQMVREDGTYPTVPLRKDRITISVVQTEVHGAPGDNPEPILKENLQYMLDSIDAANGYGGPCDLLLFHEFPLTGFSTWTREQHYNICREVPGPETEAIGEKAKQYGCYVAFGTYAKDPENWPGHILHLMVLIGPDGNIVAKHWKQRNVRGMFPGSEQFTTNIYDVYPRFIEMYGLDAVVPVAQTDIGNIAMSAVQFEPELFRCFALKGAEIICRVATGGFEYEDMRLTSYHNSLYTMITNNSVTLSKKNKSFFQDTAYGGPGRSAIFGPRGVELAVAGPFETQRRAFVPIKEFREKHRIPDVHMTLYRPVLDQYRERYDTGMYLEDLPADRREAGKKFAERARWIHYW